MDKNASRRNRRIRLRIKDMRDDDMVPAVENINPLRDLTTAEDCFSCFVIPERIGIPGQLADWGESEGVSFYAPAIVIPSMRIVGLALALRKRRSFPIAEMFLYISFKLPAMVISSTGYASSPFSIHRPLAPWE